MQAFLPRCCDSICSGVRMPYVLCAVRAALLLTLIAGRLAALHSFEGSPIGVAHERHVMCASF